MYCKQFYLGCLSHASYYLAAAGEAAVIDPQRDVEQYIAEADARGDRIKYVIETHSHADFVSGHVELAAKTGADIVYGQRANTQFPTVKVADGDVLKLGSVEVKFFETPGHTPEGICVLATDAADANEVAKLFTGDTLFVGDVGRPDLIGSVGYTAVDMASMLYDSLRDKILPLPDATEIYPAHGAGSLCGKSLSKETWSTLGEQRKFNYALQDMTKAAFVELVASDQPAVPMYFAKSAAKNLVGATALADIVKPAALLSHEVTAFDGVVIDVRQADAYGASHVANSINIGLGGQFASWAGTLIPIGTPIAIVADNVAQVDEAVTRLARVGHETASGFIFIDDFTGDTKQIEQVSVEQVESLTGTEKYLQFVDVRRATEFDAAHAYRAGNYPLDTLAESCRRLDPSTPTYVICQGGYRSSIATSILENAGFGTIYNVTGGTTAWFAAELPDGDHWIS